MRGKRKKNNRQNKSFSKSLNTWEKNKFSNNKYVTSKYQLKILWQYDCKMLNASRKQEMAQLQCDPLYQARNGLYLF